VLGALPGCTPALTSGDHTTLARSVFDLAVIDLPLRWTARSPRGERRNPQHHYPTMAVPALPRSKPMIDAVMAKNCAACFWVYGPRLPDTLKVLEGWGSIFKSELFVWVKITKRDGRPNIGQGLTTRKFCETAWLATRGNGLQYHEHVSQLIETEDDLPLIIEAPKREHSRKLDESYVALDRS
jgi:N6-adenosine-specific RNA methylase IME4